MTIDTRAVAATVMTHEHEIEDSQQQQQQQHSSHTGLVSPEGAPSSELKSKHPSSTRRGKQYKCGYCHELGHNQKTCPRRTGASSSQPTIQPALVDAADLFGNTSVALQSTGNGHATSPTQPSSSVAAPEVSGEVEANHHGGGRRSNGPRGRGRGRTSVSQQPVPPVSLLTADLTTTPAPAPVHIVHPSRLEAALEAAHKRIIDADKQVGEAITEEQMQEATEALELSVRTLEKVTDCLGKIDSCVRKATYHSRSITGYIHRRNNNSATNNTNTNTNSNHNDSNAAIVPPPSSAGLNATLGVDSEQSDELVDERDPKRQKYDHISHHQQQHQIHHHQHHQQQQYHPQHHTHEQHQQHQHQQHQQHHHHHLNASHLPMNDTTGGSGVPPSAMDGDASRDGKQGIPVE